MELLLEWLQGWPQSCDADPWVARAASQGLVAMPSRHLLASGLWENPQEILSTPNYRQGGHTHTATCPVRHSWPQRVGVKMKSSYQQTPQKSLPVWTGSPSNISFHWQELGVEFLSTACSVSPPDLLLLRGQQDTCFPFLVHHRSEISRSPIHF